jgi:CRISPR/Cas system-associated endonuclease Cas3-HD
LCGLTAKREELPDTWNTRQPALKISQFMARLYRGLGASCSFYLVRSKQDLMYRKVRNMLKTPGMNRREYEEALKAARDHEKAFYHMSVLQKDCSSGSNLEKALLNFITA